MSSFLKSAAVKTALPYVIGIGAAAGVTYGAYRLIKRVFTDDQELEHENDVAEVLNNSAPDGSTRPNITDAEASSIAQTQLMAMEGFGTDESELFDTLQGLNGKALQLVYRKFGLNPGWGGGYWPSWAGGYNMDLFGWYRMELDEEELAKMSTIWAKAGMQPSREQLGQVSPVAKALI